MREMARFANVDGCYSIYPIPNPCRQGDVTTWAVYFGATRAAIC